MENEERLYPEVCSVQESDSVSSPEEHIDTEEKPADSESSESKSTVKNVPSDECPEPEKSFNGEEHLTEEKEDGLQDNIGEQQAEGDSGKEPGQAKKRVKDSNNIKILIISIFSGISAFLAVYAVLIFIFPQALFLKASKTSAAPSDVAQTVAPVLDSLISDNRTEAETSSTPNPVGLNGNIVNILLCGIDAFESGGSTSGTMPHTDANIVVTINFDEGRVDLTSILRDTFTVDPNGNGYYKFNCIFNAGGGLDDVDAGMNYVCRAAEAWMGGVSIPYYYALDFQAVVDIINEIGGIDYYVELEYEPWDNYGYYIQPGWHHLDGNDVMGYLRIRTAADGLDSSRTARQRKMLLAIFEKLQNENKLSSLPAIINSASSGIYTNTTAAQTAALVNYAAGQDINKIYTHSLVSDLRYNYNWIINFVRQGQRAELLKEIYGIDAEPVGTCSVLYERFLYDYGFTAIKHYRQAEKVLTNVNEQVENGLKLNKNQEALYTDLYTAYTELVECFNEKSEWVQQYYDRDVYDNNAQRDEYKSFSEEFTEKEQTLRDAAIALRDELCPEVELKWKLSGRWDTDRDINKVWVDFA